jgi:hypothetical protein
MSQLLKDIVLCHCTPLIKHMVMKSVIWTWSSKYGFMRGAYLIESILKVNH